MPKKGQTKKRLVVDYRWLNSVTEPDVYPLPRTEQVLECVRDAEWFISIDLNSGFHQIYINPEHRYLTGMKTPDGHYEWNRLPFGLSGGPATFQRTMDIVLGDLKWTGATVYMDDILIWGRTFQELMERLELVCERLAKANLTINVRKSAFAQKTLKFLGHVITAEGVMMDPEKIRAITKFPKPKTVRQVQSFLGSCNYCRKFIRNYSEIAAPLTNLCKGQKKFVWSQDEQKAFDALKAAMARQDKDSVLARFDPDRKTEVRCDASRVGIGALLVQWHEDIQGWRIVECMSRKLNANQIDKWSVPELELWAVVEAVKTFRQYLLGIKFTVVSDQQALLALKGMKKPGVRMARWQLILDEYEYDVQYKPGYYNADADALSRNPVKPPMKLGTEGDCDFKANLLHILSKTV